MEDKRQNYIFIFVKKTYDNVGILESETNCECFYSRTSAVDAMKKSFEKEKKAWFKLHSDYTEKDFSVHSKYAAGNAHITYGWLGKKVDFEIKKLKIKDA